MTNQPTCPTCDASANPANFGGCCDACEAKRQARTEANRRMLRDHGQASTRFGRAIGA